MVHAQQLKHEPYVAYKTVTGSRIDREDICLDTVH